jgi:cell wall-associated NlpC family hydrolase
VIAPQSVIDQAREWQGVKFLHQGRSRHGADCFGFIAAMLAELGSPTFLRHLPLNYPRAPQARLIAGLTALSREIPLQPAALVIIQWPHASDPTHAAIYTGDNLIHCTEDTGQVVENGYRGAWVRRTAGIWALPLVRYLPQGDLSAI